MFATDYRNKVIQGLREKKLAKGLSRPLQIVSVTLLQWRVPNPFLSPLYRRLYNFVLSTCLVEIFGQRFQQCSLHLLHPGPQILVKVTSMMNFQSMTGNKLT